MSVIVKINDVDKTDLVDWRSLRKQENLTSQVDLLEFSIRKHTGQTYKPDLQDEITLFDGATKIFGGTIVQINESIDTKLETIDCVCKDYTHLMDKRLVIATYENKTIDYIIDDIKTNYLPAGFTDTSVSGAFTVGFIAFNYEQPSKCFEQLAALIGYEWYVDYDKDIHFFSRSTNSAPFNLTDTNGKYIFNSLILKKHIHNLRNTIYVRGGTFYGSSFTETQEADGDTKVFLQGYKYKNIAVKKNAVSQTVGIDNLHDPASYDVLYNFQEKAIKFKDSNKPSAGDTIEVSGLPQLPVIIKRRAPSSIDIWGGYEYKIIDKSLDTTQGAKERAKAEIIDWGDKTQDSVFETKESGLRAGQEINVQSTIRGIDKDFIISRINTKFQTPTELIYRVSIMASRSFGMNEFLQKLLKDKDKEIEINPDEILNEVEDVIETITLTETTPVVSTSHNPQIETISAGEVATLQALNYATSFVLAPYPTPTGLKRELALDGGTLS